MAKAATKSVKKVPKKVPKKVGKVAAQRVLRIVELNYYSPDSKLVQVAGAFNDWKPEKSDMVRNKGGVWTVKLELEPGKYEYKYVFDGESWGIDWNAPIIEGEFGANNILQVD